MVEIRPALYSDLTSIARLHTDNWRMNYRGILSDYYLDHQVEQDRLKTWRQRLQDPLKNQYITIATLDDNLIGFCCIYINDDPVFGTLIDNLHVSSQCQNMGIGKMLVKESAKILSIEANSKKMYLWVYEANTNARIVYDRYGGINFETLKKQNPDGTDSNVCRIIWSDASIFIT